MNCGNFCISWILSQNNQKHEESDFIFSEVFPGVTLLSKIGILLLDFFHNVEIIHKNKDIFINLKEDELPLLNEYKHRLDEFQNKGGIYSNADITIEFLENKLNDYYCIIPIKKGEGSHLVILREMDNDKVLLSDNKKGDFSVTKEEFEDLINLYNGEYVLFVRK